jgi:hypothetical protein
MLDIYSSVIGVFKRFLDSDKAILAKIKQCQGQLYIKDEALIFTLPALKSFIDESYSTSYLAFRTALYSHFINQRLGQLGGKVVIEKSSGCVDTSLYKLIPYNRVIVDDTSSRYKFTC